MTSTEANESHQPSGGLLAGGHPLPSLRPHKNRHCITRSAVMDDPRPASKTGRDAGVRPEKFIQRNRGRPGSGQLLNQPDKVPPLLTDIVQYPRRICASLRGITVTRRLRTLRYPLAATARMLPQIPQHQCSQVADICPLRVCAREGLPHKRRPRAKSIGLHRSAPAARDRNTTIYSSLL